METTSSLKTFEVTIPEEYTGTLKQFIKALKGKVKSQKKCGLDEALEDVKAGRVSKAYTDIDEMWKDLMA